MCDRWCARVYVYYDVPLFIRYNVLSVEFRKARSRGGSHRKNSNRKQRETKGKTRIGVREEEGARETEVEWKTKDREKENGGAAAAAWRHRSGSLFIPRER